MCNCPSKPVTEIHQHVAGTLSRSVPEIHQHVAGTLSRSVPEIHQHVAGTLSKPVPEIHQHVAGTLSRSVPEIHQHVAGTLSSQPNNSPQALLLQRSGQAIRARSHVPPGPAPGISRDDLTTANNMIHPIAVRGQTAPPRPLCASFAWSFWATNRLGQRRGREVNTPSSCLSEG